MLPALDAFRHHIASAKDPIAGGVVVSAVSASLALSILAMTLEVSSRRRDFSGDHARLQALLSEARSQATRMAQYADDDTAAYQQYRDALRQKQPADAALRKIIETPLAAAGGAERGLDLCAQAVPLVARSVLPDLGAAATLLAAAVKAILLSVAANLRQLPADSEFGREARESCERLAAQVEPRADGLIQKISVALESSSR